MVSIANNSGITLPMSYEDNSSILSLAQNKARTWRDLRPLEKILVFIIGLVSIISFALIIAVACLGAKLNKVESVVTAQAHSKLAINGSSTTFDPHHRTPDSHSYTTATTTSTHNNQGKTVTGVTSTTTTSTSCANPNRVCLDAECTIVAGDMLRSIDSAVNPCTNFYKFSCDNWGENNPMPDSKSRWDQFDLLEERMIRRLHSILEDEADEEADPEPVKMAQKFYDNCKNQYNQNNYTALRTFLDHLLDGFDKNIGKTLGHVRRVLGGNFLFALYVGIDEKNPSRNTIYLDQPTFGLPRAQLIPNYHPNPSLEAYERLINDVWHKVFADGREHIAASNAVRIEKILAEISTAPINRTNKADLYNERSVAQLHQMTKSPALPISWDSYFDEVFFDIYHPEDDNSKWNYKTVVLRDVHYFDNLPLALSSSNSAAMLRDYITWRIILTLANDATEELRDLVFDLGELSEGLLAEDPLWKDCVRQTNDFFGMALSHRYVEVYFDEEHEEDIRIMIDDVKKVLRKALNSDRELDWMTKSTKKVALEKLDKLQELVGHPRWLVDGGNYTHSPLLTTKLMEYYYHLVLDKDNDHFDNVIEILEWKSRETLKNIIKPAERDKWSLDPTAVAAHYIPTLNSIIFPVGILQRPFYSFNEAPVKYLNYGALGSLIGHMIAHAIDHKGSQNGADGSLHNWYDAETQKNYLARASCFTGHFTSYIAQNMSIPIHWKMSLAEESIADNIGLTLAYRAYQERIRRDGPDKLLPGFNETANQLFFLSYAQLWCSDYRLADLKADIKLGAYTPTQFRAKGGLENSIDFQRAWSCPIHVDRACNIL